MRVYLIGFMGCGKSHTGRRLAAMLECSFIELDQWIAEAAGMDIPTIFAQKGEAWFRQQEQRALHRTAEYASAIISCGGGTPCFFDNMAWMNRQGVTVYLETPTALLLSRLRPGAGQRPLLAGLDEAGLAAFIEDKLRVRAPYYQQAQVIYHQTAAAVDVARELCWALGGVRFAGRNSTET
jgi:shikimate kinase